MQTIHAFAVRFDAQVCAIAVIRRSRKGPFANSSFLCLLSESCPTFAK